jgi:hypothetical protein
MIGEEKEEEKEDQQQEREKENEKNILDKGIESWNEHFGYALREENRILFNQMLSECLSDEEQYCNAVNSKGENYSTESLLFIALIFQQQKMISQLLIAKLSQDK